MATKIALIPGILGSSLGWTDGPGGALHTCWCDLAAVLQGDLVSLQLAPDGVSPGPLAQGRVGVPWEIYAPVYGPLAAFLAALGYDVMPCPYDWRLSTLTVAAQLWPQIRQWAGGAPFNVIAHSHGGLVTRAVYGQMVAAGVGGQLARFLTMGVPHFGCLEPVRVWWRQNVTYGAIAAAATIAQAFRQGQGPAYLDAVLASHPAWYELQSFAASGPLATQFPAQAAAIYQAANYAGGNAFLSQNLFLSAQLVQAELGQWMPANYPLSIVGVGSQTAFALNPPNSPLSDSGWQWTGTGDGEVTAAQAAWPGVTQAFVPVSHGLQPLHPLCWSLLLQQLPGP